MWAEDISCWTGKKLYLTWTKARSDLKSFKRRRAGATRRAGQRLEIYQCSECRFFHLGNSRSGLSASETESRLTEIQVSRKRQDAKARRRLGENYETKNNKLCALLLARDFVF